jgi:hypothetical protein|tara:strand:+ start:2400 stop:2726 length:327 start_codon:yes stop_codon:yes gene_type:complete
MSIVFKIEAYLGRKPDFTEEIKLRNDGSGDYISEWNITSEKAKPTDSQLNALSSQATALENNAKIDAKRRTEYLSWQQQMEMIYKDQKNGTTTFKDHCDKVRSDNPKE